MTSKNLLFALLSFSALVNGQPLKRLLKKGDYPRIYGNVLDLSNQKLSDINGIEEYPDIENVTELILKDNKIKSLNPLIDLYEKYNNQLTHLDICSNKIYTVSALYKFKKSLRHLYAEYNYLNTNQLMGILLHLDLESLYIEANPIYDPVYTQTQIAGKMRNKNYLDIINYSRKYKICNVNVFKIQDGDGVFCGICLDEENDLDLYATQCLHVFHKNCLVKWFSTCKSNFRYITCPNCRRFL